MGSSRRKPTPTFVARISAALGGAKDIAVPQAYIQFTRERAFWEQLGWTRDDLYHKRPLKQVREYFKILQIVAQHEAAEIARLKAQAAPNPPTR
jgi:hypothetical protein